MRLLGYIRVSTAEQADSGLGLEAQRTRLEAWCLAAGHELTAVLVDAGRSAASLDRPALQQALAALAEGLAEGLLVLRLDRLTRSVRDLGTLLEGPFRPQGGAALVAVCDSIDTTSAGGRLVLNVLMSVAQWEREACGERTAAAMAVARARGTHCGRPPYGYRAGENGLVAVATEQAVVAEARDMRAAGFTLREVAGGLNAAGCCTRSGAVWSPEAVRRALRRSSRSSCELRLLEEHVFTLPGSRGQGPVDTAT